jgi:uncharacterized protein
VSPAEQNCVAQVEQLVIEQMGLQQAGHGIDHVQRVVRLSRQLHSEVGGNRFVIELAAWLHDIGDAKFCQGVERSAERSRELLSKLSVAPVVIEHVATIVDSISFRKSIDRSTLTLEGKIVQDADRLDALGAIGIVRTIEYGAACGQPFYLPHEDPAESKSGIGHFYQKLFKLRELLNTEPAKRLALEREQFMQQFVTQFLSEYQTTHASK